jgi:hypothetical protein
VREAFTRLPIEIEVVLIFRFREHKAASLFFSAACRKQITDPDHIPRGCALNPFSHS